MRAVAKRENAEQTGDVDRTNGLGADFEIANHDGGLRRSERDTSMRRAMIG